MDKGRLEAFSDGVIAVIITIMVLELHPPHEPTLDALREVAHPFFAYVLSFVYIGIYWNNHHHMFQSVARVNGRVGWRRGCGPRAWPHKAAGRRAGTGR